MKRNRNWLAPAGFALGLFAVFSYIPIFAQFPSTRDFPWVNLILFLPAIGMSAKGVYRAFAQPDKYRGKVSGIVLGVLNLALCGLFCLGMLLATRALPSPKTALHVGQPAPDFQLAATGGKNVSLSQLRGGQRAVLLIFYRGYW